MTATGTGAQEVSASDVGYASGGTKDAGDGGVQFLNNLDQGTTGGTGLTFLTSQYGSANTVSITPSSGTFDTVNSLGQAAATSTGTDIKAVINGMQAVGNGLTESVSSPALNMVIDFANTAPVNTVQTFQIDAGGGAMFQLGPQVTSSQQADIGIDSMASANLWRTPTAAETCRSWAPAGRSR